MNRFSELQDIDTAIIVIITLRAITENGQPGCRVKLNGTTLWDGALETEEQILSQIKLDDPLLICVSMYDKIYSDVRETAVIIDSVKIDDLEIVPKLLHVIDYENDHGRNIKTNYLGYNGVWSLRCSAPFYRWRHQATNQGWLLIPTK